MSGNYTNTSGSADTYNQGAAHDSGFYDPDRHDNQIVAVFEDEKAATVARDALADAGVPAAQIEVVAHIEGDAAPGQSQAEDTGVGDQILTALMGLFTPHDDRHDYTHAVRQGHAMVVVRPTGDTDRHRVIQVLEHSHPIDFDAKLAEWRQAGYDNNGAPRTDAQPSGQRETMAAPQADQSPERAPSLGPSRVRSYLNNRS